MCVCCCQRRCPAYMSSGHLGFMWSPQLALRCFRRKVPPLLTTVSHLPSLSFSFCLLLFFNRLLELALPVIVWINDPWPREGGLNVRTLVKASLQPHYSGSLCGLVLAALHLVVFIRWGPVNDRGALLIAFSAPNNETVLSVSKLSVEEVN